MSARLIDLLLRLAPRERLLLGLLFLVVLPAALAFGLLWPLAEARRDAGERLREAQALDAWVLARQAEKADLAGAAGPAATSEPVRASAVEKGLIAARLRPSLSALETRDRGEIALRFEMVNFTDLMRWLDGEDPGWGYEIAQLRIERTERPAMVSARLVLAPVE